MIVSRDVLMDVIEECDPVEVQPWKFGTRQRFEFKHEGKDCSVWIDFHYDEGVQLYGDSHKVEVLR